LFSGEECAGELPVFGAEPSLEFFGVDLFKYVDELRLQLSQYLGCNFIVVVDVGGGGDINQRRIFASPFGRGRCGSSG
jgi:hypothetical protein